MEQWIRDLINSALSGLRTLVDEVWKRITAVHSFILNVLVGVKDAFFYFVNGVVHGLNKLISVTREVFLTLTWIVVTRIPAAISAATRSITTWATTQINNARTYARQLYDTVTRWATDQIRAAINAINTLKTWAVNKVTEITTAISRINSLVFTLLTSPARMATWIMDALVAEFWRYIDRNSDRIFTYVRERSIVYAFRFADKLEDMLRRLL